MSQKKEILADLASAQGIDRAKFLEWFQNPTIKQSVWDEFDQARQLGVSGFPTLLGRCGHDLITFTHGYQLTEVLVPLIDQWLSRSPVGFPGPRNEEMRGRYGLINMVG